MAYKNKGKLLIKKKTEEQVCHDFDQFLPLYAVDYSWIALSASVPFENYPMPSVYIYYQIIRGGGDGCSRGMGVPGG